MPYPVHAPRRLGPRAVGLARQAQQQGQLPAVLGQLLPGSYLPRSLGPVAGPTFFAWRPSIVYGTPTQPGTSVPPAYLPRKLGPRAVGPTFFAARQPQRYVALVLSYTDASTGNLIFSGSSVESKTGADSVTGNLIFAGSSVEGKTGGDVRSGTLIFAGSAVDGATFIQTSSGTLIFAGSAVESFAGPTQPVFGPPKLFAFLKVG